MKYLYRFDSSASSNSPKGSPRLIPPSGNARFGNSSQNFISNDSVSSYVNGQIDVVNDFHWTSSPLTSRQDIPAIELKEKRLKTNSLIAQLAYYSLIASGKGGEVSGRLANLFGNSSGGFGGGALGGALQSTIGQKLVGAGQTILGAVSNFGNGLIGSNIGQFFTGKNINDFFTQTTASSFGSDVLEPYEGLYLTEDTKFSYRMPYFENMQNAVTNAFNNDDQIMSNKSYGLNKFISGAANLAENLAYTLAGTINVMEPGIYIEKPQFYSFGASGDSITFSFPLINTGWATFEDVQKNWQLIFMLIYQNRPNRKSRDLIDPPCLYEVSIPGVKYMPFAFIQNLTVQFMGARRSYKINVPSSQGFSKISTIIPDAYIVSITLKGLVAETQNLLFAMLYDKQDIVSVIESQSSTGVVDNFLDSYRRERLNQTGE